MPFQPAAQLRGDDIGGVLSRTIKLLGAEEYRKEGATERSWKEKKAGTTSGGKCGGGKGES
jgi:hypothetical protein